MIMRKFKRIISQAWWFGGRLVEFIVWICFVILVVCFSTMMLMIVFSWIQWECDFNSPIEECPIITTKE